MYKRQGLNETSGPVGVVQLVAEQTKQGGMEIFLYLTVMISINLGLVNLIPIPGLDGSRLVFMLIEACLLYTSFHGDQLLLGEAVLSLYRYDDVENTNGRSLVCL